MGAWPQPSSGVPPPESYIIIGIHAVEGRDQDDEFDPEGTSCAPVCRQHIFHPDCHRGNQRRVRRIHPSLLAQNCAACHNPNNPRNRINFLKANTIQDIESNRGLWRNVAAQLRNRTMPPVETKLSEDDRLRVAAWIDNRLRQTACAVGDFAGAVALRRLNRREYHNTIRDLLGVDYNVSELFPNDGTGGSGFDTNGETLFIPPLLVERYVEAAQQILDRAIITPDLTKTYTAGELLPAQSPANTAPRDLAPGKELTATISIYVDGDYLVQAAVERKDGMGTLALKVDGAAGVPLVVQQGRGVSAAPDRARAEAGVAPRVRRCTAFRCASRGVCACSRWSPKRRRYLSSA